MALLEQDMPIPLSPKPTAVRERRVTLDEYHAMGESGVFGDRRVELLEGEIIEMAPIGPPHAAMNDPLADALRGAFGGGHTVRVQAPLSLGDGPRGGEPQPDITVAVGAWRDYLERHPLASETRLVVEIAQSSLVDDRGIKRALYAAAGIPEYWIVNLVDNQLEVHREPSVEGYGSVSVYKVGDTVMPLFASGREIVLADVMP